MPVQSFDADPSLLTQAMPVDPMEMQALDVIEQALQDESVLSPMQEEFDISGMQSSIDERLRTLIDSVTLE